MGPTLFLIFINDIDCAIIVTRGIIKKFADDTKCMMVVESDEDMDRFQLMFDNLSNWSSERQMTFNTDKCHVLHTGRNNQKYTYQWGSGHLATTTYEKDVGVIIADSLKPSLPCAEAAKGQIEYWDRWQN